jgi:hypothetical protein
MTRWPIESRDVKGLTLEEWPVELPKVGPYCSVPGCARAADHAHHLFSRGIMGGAFDWVRLPDGTVSGNKIGICASHHQMVTENKTRIVFENGAYWYSDALVQREQPLTEQPPLVSQQDQETPPGNGHVVEPEPRHIVTPEHHREICPTCERPMPKPKVENETEEVRQRKTWAVSVPNDHWEDGADMLDELIEASRDELDKVGMSYGEGKKVKYFILATALGLFVQHAEAILSDG